MRGLGPCDEGSIPSLETNFKRDYMFFSIVGYLALVVAMGYVTLSAFFVSIMTLGKYNIGGVENPLWGKVVVLISWCLIGYAWIKLIEYSPFTIGIST